MKTILALLIFTFSAQAMAAQDKISFDVKVEYFSEIDGDLSADDIRAAGWTVQGDEDEPVFVLSKKDLSIAKLPFNSCLQGVCFTVYKDNSNTIQASLSYEDEDNTAGGEMTVYPGHPNKLVVRGNDNSTWSIRGEAIVNLK